MTQPELRLEYLPSHAADVFLPRYILCNHAQRMLAMRLVTFLKERDDKFTSKIGVGEFLLWSAGYKMIHPDYNVQLGEVVNCQVKQVEAIFAMYEIEVLIPEGRGADFWISQSFLDMLRPFVIK